jgi:hypothetical protein
MKNQQRPGKSYSEVMQEWQAKQSLFGRMRGSVFQPGFDKFGIERVWGYIWRYSLFLILPGLFYLFVFKMYGSGEGFAKTLEEQTQKFLGAESVKISSAQLDLSGAIRVSNLTAKGSPDSFFQKFECQGLGTQVGMAQVYKKSWNLAEVSAFSSSITLRSGRTGAGNSSAASADPIPPVKTSHVPGAAPRLLKASLKSLFEINPGLTFDFAGLNIARFSSSSFSVSWGSSPSTRGALTEAPIIMARADDGWKVASDRGKFHQGWFEGAELTNLKARLGSTEATIETADFSVFGTAGSFSGRVVYGNDPKVEGTIRVEEFPFQKLLPPGPGTQKHYGDYFEALTTGTITLSGSPNLASGIVMRGDFKIGAGRIVGLPIFKALGNIVGESQISQPTINSGHIRFKSSGTGDIDGLSFELDDIAMECGPLLKLKLVGTWIRRFVMEARKDGRIDAYDRGQTTISSDAVLRVGILKSALGKVKPKILSAFFKAEEDGCLWIDVPLQVTGANLTSELADEILALDTAREL